MLVEMSRLAFHFEARRGLTEAERDHLKNYLYGRVSGQVRAKTEWLVIGCVIHETYTSHVYVRRSGENCGA